MFFLSEQHSVCRIFDLSMTSYSHPRNINTTWHMLYLMMMCSQKGGEVMLGACLFYICFLTKHNYFCKSSHFGEMTNKLCIDFNLLCDRS